MNITAVAPVKAVPVIVTLLPPSSGPMFGRTALTFGGRVEGVVAVVVVVVDVVAVDVVVGDVVEEVHAAVMLRTSAASRRVPIDEGELRVTDPVHA